MVDRLSSSVEVDSLPLLPISGIMIIMAIRSYKDRGTRDIAAALDSKAARHKLPRELHRNALLKIAALDLAKSPADLGDATGLRLEKLSGDRIGQWSIRINAQYRICFVWDNGDVDDVEIIDYH